MISHCFSCAGCSDILQAMFPDSEIAMEMTVGPSIASYVFQFGLLPYLGSNLDADIDRAVGYSSQFDKTTTHMIVKQMKILFLCSESA